LQIYEQHLKDGWSASSFSGKLQRGNSDHRKLMKMEEFRRVREKYAKGRFNWKEAAVNASPPAPRWAFIVAQIDREAKMAEIKARRRALKRLQEEPI
jgi:hypothetical protein